jgi:predicted nucleotidyltransferase
MNERHLEVAQKIAARCAGLPDVEAVAVAGSQMSGHAADNSDMDVYVYSHSEMPMESRIAIGNEFSDDVEVVDYWGPGNEWIDRDSGVHVDVIFWTVGFITEQMERTLKRNEPSMGYTTSFWYTVQISQLLFDRSGWFAGLQEMSRQPYPEALAHAIIKHNYPVLRDLKSSYLRQLEKAASRQDFISLNHRAAALLASYFDIIFAVNRLPHPGEKRLMTHAEKHCAKLPENMRADIYSLLAATVNIDQSITKATNRLIDHLDNLLRQEGADPVNEKSRS